ncbi:MAG: efflux RND transporter permease subunit [Clostridium sp.]|nr:efflux RND transporter permease subunit [Clostridium sp.]
MVRYILEHRISVIMAFLALAILGCVTFRTLPVSLLPDIDIPHITVQVSEDNVSARELENTIVAPLRRQLMQTSGLSELKSETRDGSAIISLTMDYGVNTDLAFIEVNEKIDGAMNFLPKSASRPRAVKASATDIPAIYLQLTSKANTEEAFNELSRVAENIVRRRLEQLPEVAMVDITGLPSPLLKVTPDADRMEQAGIAIADIESALASNNVEPGSMTVRDGYYEYNIHVTNLLRSVQDVKSIKLRVGGRLMDLGDLAAVELTSAAPSGYSMHNGKRAVTLAVIKHSEEGMAEMKDALKSVTKYFSEKYPDIEFSETRSQTELLDFTISNLEQNLVLGLILVFIVCVLFMRSVRSSLIIGISIITGVILTFLLFYLFHVSINIISMSGLILAVGMMIDNSVIVTENIAQCRQRGDSLMRACAKGASEMITPMLSSSLTTVAVFVPLIFMSGIAGAIFSDQAFSITAGLASSYVVGITLLPVLYFIIGKSNRKTSPQAFPSANAEDSRLTRLYDRGMDFCFRHKWPFIIATALTVPLCAILFCAMPQQRMPEIKASEGIARVDWNENISLDENRRRISALDDSAMEMRSAYIGPQDYLLSSGIDLSSAEAELYFKAASPKDVDSIQSRIRRKIAGECPAASVSFSKPENVFEKIFSTNEANIEARLHSSTKAGSASAEDMAEIRERLALATGCEIDPIPLSSQIDIAIDRDLLAIYNVDFSEVQLALRTAFKGNEVSTLRSFQEYTPIEIAGRECGIWETISSLFVYSRPDKDGLRARIPLRNLIHVSEGRDLKTIVAGRAGEYVPVAFNAQGDEEELMRKIYASIQSESAYDVDFAGSFFSNAKMMREMIVIMLVSVMLMYFILCSQFGSFAQPLIVLLEIPVDTAFALLALMSFGQSLNLMSAIGIIVTCGIVVNDSILKIDAINDLRKAGMPLVQAINTAGRRRLRAIIMTSLTTIFAMAPVLFASDMGSELQRPLAIAMIGSMIVGTAVSVFIIPLFYWLIYRKHDKQ